MESGLLSRFVAGLTMDVSKFMQLMSFLFCVNVTPGGRSVVSYQFWAFRDEEWATEAQWAHFSVTPHHSREYLRFLGLRAWLIISQSDFVKLSLKTLRLHSNIPCLCLDWLCMHSIISLLGLISCAPASALLLLLMLCTEAALWFLPCSWIFFLCVASLSKVVNQYMPGVVITWTWSW